MYNAEGVVKLIDFGFAKYQEKRHQKQEVSGTPYYISPEVLAGDYGRECDVWSLGVVLFYALTGKRPFSGTDLGSLYANIKSGVFYFPKKCQLSEEVRDLISKMLTVDVRKRISIKEALKHPWFKRV